MSDSLGPKPNISHFGLQHAGKSAIALAALAVSLAAAIAVLSAPPASAVREGRGQNALFRPPVNVSRSPTASRLARTSPRSLALDPSGTAYLVWVETFQHTKGIAHELALSRFLVGAGWDSILSPIGHWEGEPSTEPAAVIGRGHLLHIAWLEQKAGAKQIAVIHFDLVTGNVTEEVLISESGHDVADPGITTDVGGRVHVVWSEIEAGQSILRHSLRGASGWQPAISVPTGQGTGAFSPDLTGDAEGNLQLAWTHAFDGGSTAMVVERAPDGAWGRPEGMGVERPGWYAGPPAVAAGEDRVWVVWAETDGTQSQVMARVRTKGSWSAVLHVSRAERFATEPSVAVDAWGTLHLLWLDRNLTDLESAAAIAYSSSAAGDTVFAEPRLLTLTGKGPFESPTIAADASGRVLAAWVDQGVPRGEIVCRSGVAGFTALAPELWHRP